jgi:response regulator RpfG family c-di-GMP phosphodiesterase
MADDTKQSILIVDDEEGIRNALVRLLKTLHVDLMVASDGLEALEVLKTRPAAIIISDQRMPRLAGVEFLAQSREISPDSVRILLTGYADIEATINAINSGAVKYYLTKPWDDENLLSRVKESLEYVHVMQENRRLQELTQQQNRQLKQLSVTLHQRVQEQTKEISSQHEELKQSFMETIKAFSTIIEMRFQEVGSHSQRVASLVKRMISGMSLGEKETQDIVVAAFLHDIGKISLPDRVAREAASNVTGADQTLVRQHPILGQSCVYAITGFEDIGLIIRHHHEDYDGMGYPDNLHDIAIPLGARAIRLVDEFDHMAFADGYPDLSALNRSAAHIVLHSGQKFDPDMVKRFIDIGVAQLLFHGEVTDVMGVKPADLQEGMIVAQDIRTKNGMFLLPRGATLSSGMINRIRKIHAVDPLAEVVRIFTRSGAKKETTAALQ